MISLLHLKLLPAPLPLPFVNSIISPLRGLDAGEVLEMEVYFITITSRTATQFMYAYASRLLVHACTSVYHVFLIDSFGRKKMKEYFISPVPF